MKLGEFQEEYEKLDLDLQVHTLMLIDIANDISKTAKKKFDKRKFIACAVLHDTKNHEKEHAQVSAEYAKKFLTKKKFPKKLIEEVSEAIYCHTNKPKVNDFTIACFYDADILCRFYALGVLRAWNNIRSDKNRDWRKLFRKVSKIKNLNSYIKMMNKKLQLKASKELLKTKTDEYIFAHQLIGRLIA